jgi:hypothetical protein
VAPIFSATLRLSTKATKGGDGGGGGGDGSGGGGVGAWRKSSIIWELKSARPGGLTPNHKQNQTKSKIKNQKSKIKNQKSKIKKVINCMTFPIKKDSNTHIVWSK